MYSTMLPFFTLIIILHACLAIWQISNFKVHKFLGLTIPIFLDFYYVLSYQMCDKSLAVVNELEKQVTNSLVFKLYLVLPSTMKKIETEQSFSKLFIHRLQFNPRQSCH